MIFKQDILSILHLFSNQTTCHPTDLKCLLDPNHPLDGFFLDDYNVPIDAQPLERDSFETRFCCQACEDRGPFWTLHGSQDTYFRPVLFDLCPDCVTSDHLVYRTFEDAFIVADRLNSILHAPPLPFPVLKPSLDGSKVTGRLGYREEVFEGLPGILSAMLSALISLLCFMFPHLPEKEQGESNLSWLRSTVGLIGAFFQRNAKATLLFAGSLILVGLLLSFGFWVAANPTLPPLP